MNRKMPYGYQIQNGVIATQSQEAAGVKRIFSLYLVGKSRDQIADALNTEGFCYSAESPKWDKNRVILEGINEFIQKGQGLGDELLDLASIVQQGGNADGIDPLTLRNRLDALTVQQAELLDKVLEDMDNTKLTDQLKAIAEEKQAILGRLGAIQQDEEQRAGQEARLRELAEWLKKQRSEFTEYDDTITRRYVERITVVDAETIRIKFKYTDVEIDRTIRK